MIATKNEITLAEIDARANTLAAARALLTDRVTILYDELTTARNRKLPGIKTAVVTVKEAESQLEQAIVAAPHLFEEPRTIVVHGLRVGYTKGRGKTEWADEKTVIEKIRQMFPDQAKVLIKTVETVRRKALGALKTDELKRIGCVVRETGDHVYIEGVADTVEKLVNRLLKEDDGEE